ncbi:uncharacterized protein LOC129305970 [Prosopis cineraria]|uniref:uncharacterized protein LOC129305970 n=1 Tax=Prosopis cineraria TaxID=364024 RepID=UPI00240EA136|nr:uncharacterized protein LOC129305970 [Prosopis cineraria]
MRYWLWGGSIVYLFLPAYLSFDALIRFGFLEVPVVDFGFNRKLDKMMYDKNENAQMEDVSAEACHLESDEKEAMKNITRYSGNVEAKVADQKGGVDGAEGKTSEDIGASGEVNMEASITADDVIRAGGFGARDDISSFLPVASDSTDFEASIRDARDYEESQGKVSRPGLGWNESTKGE